MNKAPKKLAIIDGKSVFYRGYYAMPNLSTKDGTPTGGVYGFAMMALEVIRRLKPDYVCVAWDKPKTNIRKRLEIYPKYKANRKPPPPDFYVQIPLLHELLQAFGWPLYELDDYEADDIMGTFARQADAQGIETMMITSDLDMLQCVGPLTHVYALKKGLSNIELFEPDSFFAKYQITPEQFLDLKALKGDSSDNIPGVPGIGEKGAIQLLNQYDTLDGIYENIELISGSTHKKLKAGKELAYMSKELAQIWTDAPITLNLEEVDGSKVSPTKLHELLKKFEFRSLARQLPEIMQLSEDDVAKVTSEGVDLKLPKVMLIDTNSQLLNEMPLKDVTELVVYSYCGGKHGRNPLWLLVSESVKNVYAIDLTKVSFKHAEEVLRPLFGNPNVRKIGYNIKSTIQAIYTLGVEAGIEFNGVHHDVLVGSFLLNSLRREQSLTELAQADLDYAGADLENMSPDEFVASAPTIISVIRALYEQQSKALQAIPKLEKLACDIEWPVIPVLASMEHRGILLDSNYLSNFAEQLKDTIIDLEQQIYGHADEEFNISSPAQLAVILFEKLQLPTQGVKKGKTGYSTAAAELDKLRGEHPIIELISQYREVTKLMSTYVETLPTQADKDGRIHTTYNMTTAQTGRLSSIDPNLQNIPVRTELGNHIRTAFVAKREFSFVSADYSQIELRLAAVLAEDQELIDMFNRDVDVHTATAAQVYGRQPEDVTKQMRRDAKVINFGVLYGMSPHGLSIATGMTFVAAKQFIDKYFELRKPIFDYVNNLKEVARKQGYVETLFGRRRPMPDIHSSNFMVRQGAERAAINMPIQGTGADLIKLAMIKVQDYLSTRKECHMLLQVHDSILIECPDDQAKTVATDIKEIMEDIHKLPVKLTVDTSVGKNWGEL
ncbi:MAG: DNA polymerase I [Candidatus Saccharimonadales bacterium]